MVEKIAIIDLGSNSVRMNVISVNENGGYFVFDSAKEMVRLSEGLQESSILQDEPIKRTLKALRYFKGLIEVHDVKEIHALSTAAVRMAKNKEAFLNLVEDETGLVFKILSGQEEAYYDYLGVVNSIECPHHLMIDIGGASTEICLVKERELVDSISLPIGSVILTEMFGKIKNRKKRVKEAMDYVKGILEEVAFIKKHSGLPIVGLGGSIRAIGKVDRGLNDYPIKDLHNYQMTVDEVKHIFHIITSAKDGEVASIEGINKRRADVITMGMMPLMALLNYTHTEKLIISGNGLRNGYFYEKYYEKNNLPVVVENVLEASCKNLVKRFAVNETHAYHVQKLALALFDQLESIHSFNNEDRKILSLAALFHDVGLHVEYHDHHIHGLYLLLYVRIHGLSIRNHLRVAFLVGNHRENGLKGQIDEYKTLFSKKEIRSIKELSIFLQMAEQLDRSVKGYVEDLDIKIEEDEIKIRVLSKDMPTLEMEAGLKYQDSFYKTFGYEYDIVY